MNNSLLTQAVRERKPAPEIQRKRSRAVCSLDSVPPAVETIELDVAAVAAALSQRLYTAGVPVTPQGAVDLAQALTLVSPVSPRYLYCTARAVFVSAPAHMAAFDQVFASVFGSCPDAD